MKVKHPAAITVTIDVILTITGCEETKSFTTPASQPHVPTAKGLIRSVMPFVQLTGR
jgi:hypothetical protein